MSQLTHNTPVLLVDDDRVSRAVVTRAIKKLNVQNTLYTAADGEEAIDLLQDQMVRNAGKLPPFIVLLDVNMPRMNGLEFCEAISQNTGFEDLSIYVFASREMPRHVRAKLDARVAGYLCKDRAVDTLGALFHGEGYAKLTITN
ncbi:MAG: response regulator [Roseobacter sp.]|nr:response regulator [Roseobacter sp.]